MEPLQRAQNTAAAILGRKMYTCRELYDRLCRKGFEKEIASMTVESFIRAGYLDDRRFARLYVEDAVRLGAKGAFRIRQELLQKGVSGQIIDEALESCEADTGEALKEYVKQRQLFSGIHSRRDLEKAKARLARRGYSLREINRCLDDYTFCFDEENE